MFSMKERTCDEIDSRYLYVVWDITVHTNTCALHKWLPQSYQTADPSPPYFRCVDSISFTMLTVARPYDLTHRSLVWVRHTT